MFLKRVSLLNPRVHTNFVAFPLDPGKSLEVWFGFGPRPGFSKQLFGSSREGTKLDWTCFKQFLDKYLLLRIQLQRQILLELISEITVTVTDLVGACLATGDRIFATGSDSISRIVLRSCDFFA